MIGDFPFVGHETPNTGGGEFFWIKDPFLKQNIFKKLSLKGFRKTNRVKGRETNIMET